MSAYDLLVIGGGSAGLTAATIAGKVGAKVLLADRDALGGDCLHHGCVPSKALIRCARAAHEARSADRFGIRVEGLRVDIDGVMAHVAGAVERIGRGDSPENMNELGVEVVFGGGRFLSSHTASVGDREIRFSKAVVCTGSAPRLPDIDGLSDAGYLDNTTLFTLRKLPPRIAVIGGGPVGAEMGQALARLGADVTIVQRAERILTKDDPELTDLLERSLSKELTIITGSRAEKVEVRGGAKVISLAGDSGRSTLEVDEILVAAGRAPVTNGLGLAEAGVRFSDSGIHVDEKLRTTAPNIYACGDCVGSHLFTHFAEAQARTAARNALFAGTSAFEPGPVPWSTFTDPELSHVGLSEKEARVRFGDIRVYRYSYEELDRAVCDGETTGLAKVVCTPKGVILGASILGHGSAEAVTELTVAMKAKIKIQRLASFIHVYPTMNRIVRRLGDQRFMQEGVGDFTTKVLGRFKGSRGR